MIITISGSNSFAMSRRLGELVSKFTQQNGELAIERFDAEEADGQAILDAIQAIPFLAQRKMVVVRGGANNKHFADKVEQILSSISNTTDLVLYEPNLDRRTVYFKELKRQTEFEEYAQLDSTGLASWLVAEAKKQSSKLNPADANYLVQRVGLNQQLLAKELDKLATYSADINRQNIDLLTEPMPQSKVFELLDAAFNGQKQKALKLYDDQRLQLKDPQEILAMIAWQLDLLTICKLGKDRTSQEVARDAGLNPYPVMKAFDLAAKISDSEIERLVTEALEIDYLSKSGEIEIDEALRTYIATI